MHTSLHSAYRSILIASLMLLLSCKISWADCKKNDFDKAIKKNTIAAYQEFLRKCPSGDLASQATKRLQQLQEAARQGVRSGFGGESFFMPFTGAFVRGSDPIIVASEGQAVIGGNRAGDTVFDVGTTPFWITTNVPLFDQTKCGSFITETKVKISQSMEMASAARILIDTTTDGYRLEYRGDPRTMQMSTLLGCEGTTIEFERRVGWFGFVFEASSGSTLMFRSKASNRFSFEGGLGTVTLPDGRVITLGQH